MLKFVGILSLVCLVGCSTTQPQPKIVTPEPKKEPEPKEQSKSKPSVDDVPKSSPTQTYKSSPAQTYFISKELLGRNNFKQAYDGFVRACKQKHVASCTEEGRFYLSESKLDGVANDDVKATKLFKTSCIGGDMEACYLFGYQSKHGRGTPKNLEDAKVAFRRACFGEVALACKELSSKERKAIEKKLKAKKESEPDLPVVDVD